MTEVNSRQAQADLARADRASAAVQRRTRWISTYLGAFAAGFGALTLVLGLVDQPQVRLVTATGLWVAFVVLMATWARRQPAAGRRANVQTAPYWAASMVCYLIVLLSGLPGRQGQVAFWIPAAILVAAPLAFGAWREHRR